jgi:8-oxo-dGTP pyrophosphatase MutT (NUDIX family)
LRLAGATAAIGSVEPDLAQALVAAGLPLRAGDGGWRIDGAADASLAAIARWLHGQGIGSRWRGELLAVTDEQGRSVAAVERAVVRPLGIVTHAVHLVGVTPAGAVWVQRRALDKATDPGLWDTLMGGLVVAHEAVPETLERETWEEAGLRLDALHDLAGRGRVTVRRPVPDGYMVERVEVFVATVPDGVVPANRDGEVERFECLAPDALGARLRADAFTLEAALVLLRALPALDVA